MRKILLSVKLLLLFALFILPAQGYAGQPTALSDRPTGRNESEFLIGLIPEENIFTQIQRHKPLAAYLSGKLGVKVRFTILSRYGDIVDRFVARDMDGAFFGIFTAVLAQEKLGVVPVVRQMGLDGSTAASGYMFARKDSGIRSVADMKGKRAAFVDRATATGFIFPLALLREAGIKDLDEYFSEYYFTGSHASAIYAVLDGRADVGAAKSRILDKLSRKDPLIEDEIRIIAKSQSLPDTTLCIRKDIPVALKRKLTEALTAMDKDPKGKEALKTLGALKFVRAGRADFRAVIEMANKAGISIKDYRYR